MHEEYEERQMNRTEEFADKTEKMAKTSIGILIKNKEEKKRNWFQTQKERQEAKSMSLANSSIFNFGVIKLEFIIREVAGSFFF